MVKILIIGRGAVGNALYLSDSIHYTSEADIFDIMGHDEFLQAPGVVDSYDGVVNCAALHDKEASWDDIIEANVGLPNVIQEACSHKGVSNIHFSTAGVYKQQVSKRGEYLAEYAAKVYPHNMLVASKLLMETTLLKDMVDSYSMVLRMSFFEDRKQWELRIEHWTQAQNTWVSIVRVSTLRDAILAIVRKKIKGGIVNIASEDVYLPAYASQFCDDLDVRTNYPRNMTSAVLLDTSKAKRWGIL